MESKVKRSKTNESLFSHIRPKSTIQNARKPEKSMNFQQIENIYTKEKAKTREALSDFESKK